MARTNPEIDLAHADDYFEHDSEAKVYAALKEMGDAFHIYHSVRYLDFDRGYGSPEGEIDFLILHKHKGLLVLEAKGGAISYRKGTWYSGDNKITPYEQARKNEHSIIGKLKNRGVQPDFPYGYAVCFPDCDVPRHSGLLEHSSIESKDVTLGRNDLSGIEEHINNLFALWGKGKRWNGAMSKRNWQATRNTFRKEFKLVKSLGTTIEQNRSHLLRLSEQQQRTLHLLQNHSQVAISGPAGSGKTLLAIEKARRLADEGNEVLFLTYNKPIAEKLKRELRGEREVEVSNLHAWGHGLARRARGVSWPRGDLSRTFWAEEFPVLLDDAIKETGKRYSALIIDEGQDFRKSDFDVLQEVLREDGMLYVFYDSNQDVYGTYENLGLAKDAYPLPYNYRNPRKLVKYIRKNADVDLNPDPDRSQGERPKVRNVRKDTYAESVEETLKDLSKEGVKGADITLIVEEKDRFFDWLDRKRLAGYKLRKGEYEPDFDGIRVASLKRFKGLESEVVVVCEVPEVSEVIDDPEKLYVALTRAVLRAYVLKAS